MPRSLSPIDWVLILLVGCALPVAFVVGANAARDATEENVLANAFELGSRTHQNVDPLRPPGLPEGVTVDPKTGYLVGADSLKQGGERFLTWSELRVSDYPNGIADVPDDIRALEGETIAMVGFVMPLYEPAQFREFVLVGSTFTCCYGAPPGLGGILKVDLRSDVPPLDMDPRPIIVRGRLVIEEFRLNERPDAPVVLLYRIEAGKATVLG